MSEILLIKYVLNALDGSAHGFYVPVMYFTNNIFASSTRKIMVKTASRTTNFQLQEIQ